MISRVLKFLSLIWLVCMLLNNYSDGFQQLPYRSRLTHQNRHQYWCRSCSRRRRPISRTKLKNGIITITNREYGRCPSAISMTTGRLADCVCLVTGASRGIGKGIALELGAEGATVYVTGTTSSQTKSMSMNTDGNDKNNSNRQSEDPGSVEETAQAITQMGGHGIAVVCNHAVDDEVARLMERIDQDHGRLDILVNNAFRLPAGGVQKLYGKFWEQGIHIWDTLHNVGLRSHFVATCFAMPLLRKAAAATTTENQQRRNNLPRPLIAMISSFGGITYTFNVPYGVQKAAVDRLVKDMAVELTPENIAVVSLWPGLVSTERTEISVANGDWDRYVRLPLDHAESPRFTGRAVVNIALDDKNLIAKSGTYQVVAELAQEYGFTDVDGTIPPSIRSLRFLVPTYGLNAEQRKQIPAALIPDWKLPFWIMAQGAPPSQT